MPNSITFIRPLLLSTANFSSWSELKASTAHTFSVQGFHELVTDPRTVHTVFRLMPPVFSHMMDAYHEEAVRGHFRDIEAHISRGERVPISTILAYKFQEELGIAKSWGVMLVSSVLIGSTVNPQPGPRRLSGNGSEAAAAANDTTPMTADIKAETCPVPWVFPVELSPDDLQTLKQCALSTNLGSEATVDESLTSSTTQAYPVAGPDVGSGQCVYVMGLDPALFSALNQEQGKEGGSRGEAVCGVDGSQDGGGSTELGCMIALQPIDEGETNKGEDG